MGDALRVLLVSDENTGDVVCAQEHVGHVVLFFDGRASAWRRALGDELGRELEELLNAASLEEAERVELVSGLEYSRLAVAAGVRGFVENEQGEDFHSFVSQSAGTKLRTMCSKTGPQISHFRLNHATNHVIV